MQYIVHGEWKLYVGYRKRVQSRPSDLLSNLIQQLVNQLVHN